MFLHDGTPGRFTSLHVLFLDLGVGALGMLRRVFHEWMLTPGMRFLRTASALLITEWLDLCNDPQPRKLYGNICLLLHGNVHRDSLTSFPGSIAVPSPRFPASAKRLFTTTSPAHLFRLLQVATQTQTVFWILLLLDAFSKARHRRITGISCRPLSSFPVIVVDPLTKLNLAHASFF